MADVLIIGGGICGLGAALLLARDGHEVTVLERDADPVPDSPQEAWSFWARKGVTQFRQPHNFMPGLRLILEAELPDVQEALRLAGASRFDMAKPLPPFFADQSPRAIDDQLWTYTARRPVGMGLRELRPRRAAREASTRYPGRRVARRSVGVERYPARCRGSDCRWRGAARRRRDRCHGPTLE